MKKVFFKNILGEKLVGVLHKSKKKTNKGIILVHGFKGNKDRDLIFKLSKELEKKYNVLRFDFSGNGESEGKFEDQSYSKYVEELRIAIDFLKKERINKVCIIAHSLGTNISILEQYKYKNINNLILIAPAIYVKTGFTKSVPVQFFTALLTGSVKLKLWDFELKKERILRLKKQFFFERLFYNMGRYLKKIRIPIYVILAEKDKAIPLEKSIKLCKKRGIEYSIIKGAKHNFREDEQFNKMKNETLKFLKDF